jgi:hypothetical protein
MPVYAMGGGGGRSRTGDTVRDESCTSWMFGRENLSQEVPPTKFRDET